MLNRKLNPNRKKALSISAFFFVTCIFVTGLGFSTQVWPDQTFMAEVKQVIDGDTVVLTNGEKVRLIGINAPEKESDHRLAQPYSLEARLALVALVQNKTVRIETGLDERDRYGRLLGSLYLPNGEDVQAILLKKGYAVMVVFPPNLKNLDRYVQAENQAREFGLGVWSEPDFIIDMNEGKYADKLENGFAVISAKVIKLRASQKYKRFSMGKNLDILIKQENWKHYWTHITDDKLANQTIEVRGWISGSKNKKRMIIRHPAELKIRANNQI